MEKRPPNKKFGRTDGQTDSVFALVKNLFGDAQLSALKDYIQAALKLNYNGRVVG